uniref:Uncharacterized protein n=1 Tax=Chromera velia CCMP2878 TaxID=1169474 RepID=A0A0G4GSX5_9ALVE|mmetsp:Transcript_1915/g.4025  ORF Transcript_1915/g.4025 Transcript_1915/m.4025 type:complete len:1020 (+) Transcript_1915:113-3172(+)|eukprot:Cvel_23244.t1-p1 / transcript=Cvel_23244.t1 / gene=Cvel_23244 / organism=Chromera_velia_CCMP2878 / gene_product=hypothetical protein / transcript_product=hypothetical protein / location=Cvel_scaffold2375:6442-11263(-) / protein_length=1019 / sequence_SO=supercontig / SO=protein_coding / is_pseudo=false
MPETPSFRPIVAERKESFSPPSDEAAQEQLASFKSFLAEAADHRRTSHTESRADLRIEIGEPGLSSPRGSASTDLSFHCSHDDLESAEYLRQRLSLSTFSCTASPKVSLREPPLTPTQQQTTDASGSWASCMNSPPPAVTSTADIPDLGGQSAASSAIPPIARSVVSIISSSTEREGRERDARRDRSPASGVISLMTDREKAESEALRHELRMVRVSNELLRIENESLKGQREEHEQDLQNHVMKGAQTAMRIEDLEARLAHMLQSSPNPFLQAEDTERAEEEAVDNENEEVSSSSSSGDESKKGQGSTGSRGSLKTFLEQRAVEAERKRDAMAVKLAHLEQVLVSKDRRISDLEKELSALHTLLAGSNDEEETAPLSSPAMVMRRPNRAASRAAEGIALSVTKSLPPIPRLISEGGIISPPQSPEAHPPSASAAEHPSSPPPADTQGEADIEEETSRYTGGQMITVADPESVESPTAADAASADVFPLVHRNLPSRGDLLFQASTRLPTRRATVSPAYFASGTSGASASAGTNSPHTPHRHLEDEAGAGASALERPLEIGDFDFEFDKRVTGCLEGGLGEGDESSRVVETGDDHERIELQKSNTFSSGSRTTREGLHRGFSDRSLGGSGGMFQPFSLWGGEDDSTLPGTASRPFSLLGDFSSTGAGGLNSSAGGASAAALAAADKGSRELSGNVARLNVFLLNLCRIRKKEKTMETDWGDNRDLRNPKFKASVSFPALGHLAQQDSILKAALKDAEVVTGDWQGNKMLAKEDACSKALEILEPKRDFIEARLAVVRKEIAEREYAAGGAPVSVSPPEIVRRERTASRHHTQPAPPSPPEFASKVFHPHAPPTPPPRTAATGAPEFPAYSPPPPPRDGSTNASPSPWQSTLTPLDVNMPGGLFLQKQASSTAVGSSGGGPVQGTPIRQSRASSRRGSAPASSFSLSSSMGSQEWVAATTAAGQPSAGGAVAPPPGFENMARGQQQQQQVPPPPPPKAPALHHSKTAGSFVPPPPPPPFQ